MATQMQLEVILVGNCIATSVLKSKLVNKDENGKRKLFLYLCLLKSLSLDKLSCPQIWSIEQEKDREKEKVGGSPAKLNEKKGDRHLEREIKNRTRHFFVGRTT